MCPALPPQLWRSPGVGRPLWSGSAGQQEVVPFLREGSLRACIPPRHCCVCYRLVRVSVCVCSSCTTYEAHEVSESTCIPQGLSLQAPSGPSRRLGSGLVSLCLRNHQGLMSTLVLGALVPQMTLPSRQDSGRMLPTSPYPYLAGWHDLPHFSAEQTEALRVSPAVEPCPPRVATATSETREPFAPLPWAWPLISDPRPAFPAGLSHTHTQPRLPPYRTPVCFFLIPGRPIRWALKIFLNSIGRPSPGQQLHGQLTAGRGHQEDNSAGALF